MKLIRTLLLAVALSSVTACAQLQQAFDVANIATATINNPVTPTMVHDLKNASIIAFAAIRAYRQTCLQGAIPQSCKTVLRKIRVYTLKIPPLIEDLEAFVQNNDQINAILVYNTAVNVMTNMKAQAALNKVGGV